MTESLVINASPLILLGRAGELAWVPKLGRIMIPGAVVQEMLAGGTDDPASQWLTGKGVHFITPDAPDNTSVTAWDLGAGETAVITQALCHPGAEAVLDDAAARRCAAAHGVPVRGTLSLVLLAKRRGFIPACQPVFLRLTAAGLFVTEALINKVLANAGEPPL